MATQYLLILLVKTGQTMKWFLPRLGFVAIIIESQKLNSTSIYPTNASMLLNATGAKIWAIQPWFMSRYFQLTTDFACIQR